MYNNNPKTCTLFLFELATSYAWLECPLSLKGSPFLHLRLIEEQIYLTAGSKVNKTATQPQPSTQKVIKHIINDPASGRLLMLEALEMSPFFSENLFARNKTNTYIILPSRVGTLHWIGCYTEEKLRILNCWKNGSNLLSILLFLEGAEHLNNSQHIYSEGCTLHYANGNGNANG